MRFYLALPTPLATAVVRSAERHRRRPGDELVVLVEDALRDAGALPDGYDRRVVELADDRPRQMED